MKKLAIGFTSLICLLAPACSSSNTDDTKIGDNSTGGALQNTGGAAGGTTGTGGAASGGTSSILSGGANQSSGGTEQSSGGTDQSSGGTEQSSGGSVGSGGGSATGGQGSETGGAGGSGGAHMVQICDPPATLKEAGECNDILVGTALTTSHLNENEYTTTAREFNYVTPENEMKWGNLQAQPDQFNFGQADQVVNFALDNGMQVKGHTLVWHMQLPGWVNNLNSEDAVRSAMLNHIEKVMEHYKGKVVAWDVVNEATDIDDKATGSGNPRYRDTIFYRFLGETYVDEAFIAARAMDDDVKLFYNDFGADGLNEKSDKVYELVKGLVERGVPIDGVGMQGHMGRPNPVPPLADIVANFQRIADLGLEIQISELDINGCDPNVSVAVQEQAYHDMVTACVNQPMCTAVSSWGITDKYSWIDSFDEAGCNGQSGSGLPWDNNYQKKGIYDAMVQALTGH